ncbi:hypothetical protein C9I56_01675 [Paraburkholderia caribensis]|uniref:Uncharacterized protein n=1 Tax=Paraburkholderia caribensis TaxID=75105 RepID=A0A9Q6S0I6_9BURK|nr:hypothetical protein C9I56_01675 [Paraburkholderia caribensis]QLB62273.1 hypothetical protein A9O66_07690 [Paraburkholderia caribensis]
MVTSDHARIPVEQGGTLENTIEADIIIRCLDDMARMRAKARADGKAPRKISVAVITPYRAQY